MASSEHGFNKTQLEQLPIPRLKLISNDLISNYGAVKIEWVDKASHAVGGGVALTNFPVVVANDISTDLLSNYNIYVEMLRYRRGKSPSGSGYNNAHGAGYSVPSSWTGGVNSLDGRWTRGGLHTSTLSPSGLMPSRPNHYQVTSPNQVIPVWEYYNNRFTKAPVAYRDVAGNTKYLNATIPLSEMNKYVNTPTKRFGSSSRYTPFYSTFRYVLEDKATGDFFSGPTSRVVKITASKHPFIPDPIASAINTDPCVNINSQYDENILKAYIETKLP